MVRDLFFRGRLLCIIALALMCQSVLADQESEESGEPKGWHIDEWAIQTSIYTHHFDPDPEHVNDQNLLGVEAWMTNGWLVGAAVFDNSFGQNSQLVYVGYSWPLFSSRYWYFKLTGGLLHGYKPPYEDKIPFNSLGVAPAIVPALGFRYKYFVAEANLGGLAVVTVTAGVRF